MSLLYGQDHPVTLPCPESNVLPEDVPVWGERRVV